MEDYTTLDLTQYKGGIVFAHIDIGKMPPQRVKQYLESLRGEMRAIIKYLEANGFVVIFMPHPVNGGPRQAPKWTVWGMNKPYDPSTYDSKGFLETDDINLDVVSQAIEASSRRLRP